MLHFSSSLYSSQSNCTTGAASQRMQSVMYIEGGCADTSENGVVSSMKYSCAGAKNYNGSHTCSGTPVSVNNIPITTTCAADKVVFGQGYSVLNMSSCPAALAPAPTSAPVVQWQAYFVYSLARPVADANGQACPTLKPSNLSSIIYSQCAVGSPSPCAPVMCVCNGYQCTDIRSPDASPRNPFAGYSGPIFK